VLECLNDLALAVPVVRVGWPDAFIEHGKPEALKEKYGLTAEGAMKKAAGYVQTLVDARAVARR
jgi:1-deoxy-D-xylulose-5-phosphate synthase